MTTRAEMARIDWNEVKRHYCAGILTLAEIARTFGSTPEQVMEKARRCNWAKDLGSDIRAAAKKKLTVASCPKPEPTTTEIIDSASSEIVRVVLSHRTLISKAKREVDRAFDAMAADEDPGKGSEITALANALKILVGLERQAIGADDQDSQKKENLFDLVVNINASPKVIVKDAPGVTIEHGQ